MKRKRIILLIIICAILLQLMSCTLKESKAKSGDNINKPTGVSQNGLSKEKAGNQVTGNQEKHSIKIALKRISQEEYDNGVLKTYKAWQSPANEQFTLPDIADFDYPCVEGIDDQELESKIIRL